MSGGPVDVDNIAVPRATHGEATLSSWRQIESIINMMLVVLSCFSIVQKPTANISTILVWKKVAMAAWSGRKAGFPCGVWVFQRERLLQRP